MKKIKDQINAYYYLRKYIKSHKNNKNNDVTDFRCFIIAKEDMLKWKKYYEINESLLNSNSNLNKWETKISLKMKEKILLQKQQQFQMMYRQREKSLLLNFLRVLKKNLLILV